MPNVKTDINYKNKNKYLVLVTATKENSDVD